MFDQSAISSIDPPVASGGQLHLSWTGTTVPGGWFQVYADSALTWTGSRSSCTIQAFAGRRRIAIGAVGPSERYADFSALLAPAPANRATLSWLGGTFEGADIAGWDVFGEATPGGGISYGSPLATIAAVEAGISMDGFGMGGFGMGGFGAAAGEFTWTSGPLSSGTWHFAVVPFDRAGNPGVVATVAQAILVAPAPPARDSAGNRLEYAYNPTTRTPTLTWLASPG